MHPQQILSWLGSFWKLDSRVWRGFAHACGGDLLKRNRSVRGVFTRRGSWELVVHRYAFRLSSGTRWHTRVTTCCRIQQRLSFQLEAIDPFRRFLRALGRMDTRIGDPEIEKEFVIRTDNPKLLARLLRDPILRQQVRTHRGVWIELVDEPDYDEDLVARSGPLFRCHVPRTLKSLSALRQITESTATMVSRLEALSVIAPRPTRLNKDVKVVPLGGVR